MQAFVRNQTRGVLNPVRFMWIWEFCKWLLGATDINRDINIMLIIMLL
jgi:hypothetical protein